MTEQQMIENIEQSVQQCQQKAETMLNKCQDVVVEADIILQAQDTVKQSEGGGTLDFGQRAKFHPHASTKPQRLEREASFANVLKLF